MKLIDRVVGRLEAAFQQNSAAGVVTDIEVFRQNSPPDELDAELAEGVEYHELVLGGRETSVARVRAKAAGKS
jgi:hypothetical protein